MNKILEKAIVELKKDTFSKEYVLGMLETLVEMQDSKEFYTKSPAQVARPAIQLETVVQEREVDEAEMLEKLAAARLKEVQEASTIEVVTQK